MRFQETQKVVVARAGSGGPVVYLTEDDDWTRELREAELILDEAHAQVRMLSPGGRGIAATDLHLAEVCCGPNGLELAPAARLGR